MDRNEGSGGGFATLTTGVVGVGAAALALLAVFWTASVRGSIPRLVSMANESDARLDALERRPLPEAADGVKQSLAFVETELRRLKNDVAALRSDVASARSPDGLAELTARVEKLGEEVAAAEALAAGAADEARAAALARAAQPETRGVPDEDLVRISASLAALEQRVAGIEQRKPAASEGSPVKLNEQAVRELVKKITEEEVRNYMQEMRDRRRRPPGGG